MNWLWFLPMLGRRLLRKVILDQGRRIAPERLLARSRRQAIQAAVRASRQSAAYRVLLQEHHIEPASLGVGTDLAALPVLTKNNTFERFTLDKLAGPMPVHDWADVLTSSGRGGRTFGFKLTSRARHESSWFDIDIGLQDLFNVDGKSTLLVNCLPMGVVFKSRAVTVANVSVREDMACSILRAIGPKFEQTVVCTDPLFVRRILDQARLAGLDWKALNASFLMGEEVLVEAQRDYLAARLGIDLDHDVDRTIISSYGVGELGLNLMFETRDTIRLRRAMRARPEVARLICGGSQQVAAPAMFCYNPLRCYVEVINPDADGFGEMCITMFDPQAIIPLPRYATGDVGKLISAQAAAQVAQLAATTRPWLPMVAVRGRIKDRPAGLPPVESVKELIYRDHAVADQLTGAFRIAQDDGGTVTLSLQTNTDAAALDPALRQSLLALLASDKRRRIELALFAPLAFPWRPVLDYERKFSYVEATGC